jgi:hypothetical protein
MAEAAHGEGADALRARLEKALAGHYRILRLLGRGGMGAVYLAREEALERLVAIKVLGAGSLDAEARERFRREALNGARLTHPGIVPLHAFGEADGVPYLAMGYVRGETLAARLRREGRVATAEARRILADVAEALDHAHRAGIVHRDVKPDNIMIDDETGRALLTDFGIAKATAAGQTLTQAGGLVGTPQYMSPEQVSGGAGVDGRSDVYALGLTAYAMLAGRLPFEGPPQEALLRRLTREPPPLRQVAPDVPEDLAGAVMRCLARDPEARWPDAHAFREAASPVRLDDEELPEPLDTLDGGLAFILPFVAMLLLGMYAVWVDVAWITLEGRPHRHVHISALAGVAIVLGGSMILLQIPTTLSAAALARRRGFGWGQILATMGRQPRWWLCLWYPRRLRRPGDVWDRLPRPFRRSRVTATLLLLALLPWLALTMYTEGRRVAQAPPFVQETVGTELTVAWVVLGLAALGAALSQIPCALMLRRRGYETYTLRRVARALLIGPTADRGLWKKPELSRVLEPPAGEAAALPQTPSELVSAIARAADTLGGGRRELGPEALALGRRLHAELQGLEREIARLARESDPAEAARLDARLTTLGADEQARSDEELQMKRLLGEQRDLLHRLQQRLHEARDRQERCREGLREVWRGLQELASAPASDEAALAARLRERWASLEAPVLAADGTLTRAVQPEC